MPEPVKTTRDFNVKWSGRKLGSNPEEALNTLLVMIQDLYSVVLSQEDEIIRLRKDMSHDLA